MAANLNGTFDILKFIEEKWSSFGGMLFVWFLEVILSVWGCQLFLLNRHIYFSIWIAFLFVTTLLVWTIQTKRWFQRTGYWVLLHYACIVVISAVCYFVIYPIYIAETKCDIAYIQYWLTAIISFLLIIGSYLYIIKKRDKLCIVFLVLNQSKHEQDIIQALTNARAQVEQTASNIQIVIPPFGIAKTFNECYRYINGFFNQADAVIFASLIDSPQESEFGYVFNGFSSIMSNRYVKRDNRDDANIEILIGESYRCHEWNTLNFQTDQISRQLKVAGNLTHLFLMYVSCIYLQKHRYTKAIEVAESLYEYTATGNKAYDDSVRNLLAHSYVMAEQREEHENHNYTHAHQILDECLEKLPQIRYTLVYNLALARLYFYEGNFKESKRVTKRVKDSFKGSEWYVAVNMAFYAICEQRPGEMVTHYKKMLKMPKQMKDEVEFSIRFLKIEIKNTTDQCYLMFLYHGLTFLLHYIDESLSDKYYQKLIGFAGIYGYMELENMRELIRNSKGKLHVRNNYYKKRASS